MGKAAPGKGGAGAGAGPKGDSGGSPGGMDRGQLKQHLRYAQDEPIPIAFALGGDGKAVIQLHRHKPGHALEADLKKSVPGARNARWGTAHVDPEDPKALRLTLNKAGGGLARKLVLALKGTGIKKIKLATEDGVEFEAHEEEDEAAQAEADGAAGQAPSGPVAGEPVRTQEEAAAPVRSEDGPADAAALAQSLTGLVKRMLEAIKHDPSQRAALVELATDAQASVKRGDLDQAAAGIEVLRMALDGAGGGTGGAAGGKAAGAPGAVAASPQGSPRASPGSERGSQPEPADPAVVRNLQKSRDAWNATRAKVDGEMGKLSKALLAASEGEDVAAGLEEQFLAVVQPVLATLDGTLSELLAGAAEAGDAERRAELLDQARGTIREFQAIVQSNPVIRHLDDNPFVPLAIGKVLTGTLSTISSIIR